MKRIAILIDGGFLREISSPIFRYNPDFIEKVALGTVAEDEELVRALYYDCDPFRGELTLPVSGQRRVFDQKGWLDILAAKDLFAVRRGVLKFRGFKPKETPIRSEQPTDADFRPDFEQKGVDMRIGLDIATFAASKTVDRIVLITGDTDCVPAMKHGRIAGLQVVIAQFPAHNLSRELLWHSDFCRLIEWPSGAERFARR